MTLTLATLVGLTWPILIQDGMFMDGVLYSCVAHNLSQGFGTFWFPQFSEHNMAGLSSFHEQPPLVFGIQALFFKVLGSSMYVERFYTALTSIIAALLIRNIWRDLTKHNSNLAELSWLPVLLWITIPVCFWSYQNNMQENTMTVFCLLSFLTLQRWLNDLKPWRVPLAACFVFLAVLSKGVPGFFPLVVPLVYTMIVRDITVRKAAIATVGMLATITAFFTILLLFNESRTSLNLHFFHRALTRISDSPTVDNRLYIIGQLLMEMLVHIMFVAAILLFKRNQSLVLPQRRKAFFLVMVGLAGSLPLILTRVQKPFYFVPSLPFFALGFALLIAPVVLLWIRKLSVAWQRRFALLSVIALVASIGMTILRFGSASRNKELLHDVYAIGKIIPRNSSVSIPDELRNRWDLQCYLMRYFSISVQVNREREYFLTDRQVGKVPDSYIPIQAGMHHYQVFKSR